MVVGMRQIEGVKTREVILYPRDMAVMPHRFKLAALIFGAGTPVPGAIAFHGTDDQYVQFLESVGDREALPVTV